MSLEWNSEFAKEMLVKMGNARQLNETSTKTFQFQFGGGAHPLKEMAIARVRKNDVTIYVNQLSLSGQVYPENEMGGITVQERYPKGFQGKNGNPGIAGSVSRLPSLDPSLNDVVRLKVSGPEAFTKLVAWYAGAARA